MSKLNKAIKVFKTDYKFLVGDIRHIKKQLDESVSSIDVRLCLDFDQYNDPSWIIRSGDSSFDQAHSQYCGASSLDSDTIINIEADPTVEELIDQVLDQIAESE